MSQPPEAVGAYKDKKGGTNWLPLILGLLALVILALILLFAFSGGDDEVDRGITDDPQPMIEDDDDTPGNPVEAPDVGPEEFGDND
jgi:hypothetical protein